MINQIHSETYFSTIRASLGGCTNPTTVQFTSAYKKLLFGACNKTKYGNCILQDDSKLLLFPNCKPVKAADEIVQSFDLTDNEQTEVYLSAMEKTSEFSKNALTYISGFIHRKIIKKETCLSCHDVLKNESIRTSCKFIDSVNRGRLVHPSSSLNLVVKITNSCIEEVKNNSNILQHKNIVQSTQRNVMNILNSRHPNLFSILDTHVDKERIENSLSHRILMIKKIVSCYLSLRLKHLCKEKNSIEFDKRFKRKSSKLIHFKNQ